MLTDDQPGQAQRARLSVVNPLTESPCTWLADWSDGEDDDFRDACRSIGVAPDVIRSAHTGVTVGTRAHRLRSYPQYGRLAMAALRKRDRPVVFWQPLAATPALLGRRGTRPPIIVLSPLLSNDGGGKKQAVILKALRDADRIIFLSSPQADDAIGLGVNKDLIRVMPLGVRAQVDIPVGPGEYLLAGGREHRDWPLMAKASVGVPKKVRIGAPNLPDDTGGLDVVPPLSREDYNKTLVKASALVVPLIDAGRPAGLLAILQALSFGIPVIATRGPLTEEYLTDGSGILVDVGDVDQMRAALVRLSDDEEVRRLGAGALAEAKGRLSLATFVSNVHALAQEVA